MRAFVTNIGEPYYALCCWGFELDQLSIGTVSCHIKVFLLV